MISAYQPKHVKNFPPCHGRLEPISFPKVTVQRYKRCLSFYILVCGHKMILTTFFFFHNFTPVALRGQFTEYTDFADYSLLMSNQEMGTDK